MLKTSKEIKALQLASMFSLVPNSLGYCGKGSASAKFKKCIASGKCDGIEEELKYFIVLYPYLKTIAQITKHPVFSYPVIESYWLGNDELKKFNLGYYDLLLENFVKQGIPENFVKGLSQNRPKRFLPTHLFQVLHVGVGRASGAVPFSISSINNCMIRWGEVEEIDGMKASISLNSLRQESQIYRLTKINEILLIDKKTVMDIEVGAKVAVHWKKVVKILTVLEEENLSFWTKEVLDSLP